MTALIALKNFTLTVDRQCTDVDGYPYREMVWSNGCHEINVHEDAWGYHCRVDGGRVAANLDARGLVAFVRAEIEG